MFVLKTISLKIGISGPEAILYITLSYQEIRKIMSHSKYLMTLLCRNTQYNDNDEDDDANEVQQKLTVSLLYYLFDLQLSKFT